MIYPADAKKLFRSLRIIATSDSFPALKDFLKDNIEHNTQLIYNTVDEREVNRYIGENKALSAILHELENSPQSEAANANSQASSCLRDRSCDTSPFSDLRRLAH